MAGGRCKQVGVDASAEDYVESRVSTLRKAMRAAGARKDASLPVAFIENSSHCSVNAAGEKVIGPNKDRRWLPELMAQVQGLPPPDSDLPLILTLPVSAKYFVVHRLCITADMLLGCGQDQLCLSSCSTCAGLAFCTCSLPFAYLSCSTAMPSHSKFAADCFCCPVGACLQV